MDAGLIIAAALAADWLLGELRHGHPLVGFGWLAGRLERAWNRRAVPEWGRRGLGAVAVAALVVPVVLAGGWLSARAPAPPIFEVIVLYLAIGLKSLCRHAERVQRALDADEIEQARAAVGRLVSRDTSRLDAPRAASATIESLLENGNDAIFATLFWFLVAGVPGVLMFRLINTLDAMWGHRTHRLAAFGATAARLDDALNWVPARLTALTYALVSGHPVRALTCAWRQGRRPCSPNAGVVMAAGAGALHVRVGGPGVYHGKLRWRPRFGCGMVPTSAAIGRTIRLVQGGALAWTAMAVLPGLAFA